MERKATEAEIGLGLVGKWSGRGVIEAPGCTSQIAPSGTSLEVPSYLPSQELPATSPTEDDPTRWKGQSAKALRAGSRTELSCPRGLCHGMNWYCSTPEF